MDKTVMQQQLTAMMLERGWSESQTAVVKTYNYGQLETFYCLVMQVESAAYNNGFDGGYAQCARQQHG
jgi:hypothetical protein